MPGRSLPVAGRLSVSLQRAADLLDLLGREARLRVVVPEGGFQATFTPYNQDQQPKCLDYLLCFGTPDLRESIRSLRVQTDWVLRRGRAALVTRLRSRRVALQREGTDPGDPLRFVKLGGFGEDGQVGPRIDRAKFLLWFQMRPGKKSDTFSARFNGRGGQQPKRAGGIGRTRPSTLWNCRHLPRDALRVTDIREDFWRFGSSRYGGSRSGCVSNKNWQSIPCGVRARCLAADRFLMGGVVLLSHSYRKSLERALHACFGQ